MYFLDNEKKILDSSFNKSVDLKTFLLECKDSFSTKLLEKFYYSKKIDESFASKFVFECGVSLPSINETYVGKYNLSYIHSIAKDDNDFLSLVEGLANKLDFTLSEIDKVELLKLRNKE